MRFIRSEEEFVKALSIQSVAADFALMESQQPAVVENYITPVTGEALLVSLNTKIDNLDTLSPAFEGLLAKIQRAVALLAYLRSIPMLDVNARPGGFTVNVDENTVAASKYRVRAFKQGIWYQSQEAMNSLVAHLDKYRDEFVGYKDTAIEKRRYANFVNTYAEWSDSLQHQAGDWVIDRLRPVMSEIEFRLHDVICTPLFDFLKSKIEDRSNAFGIYAGLVPLIRHYVCNATMADLVHRNNIMVTGSRAYMSYEEGDDADLQSRSAGVVDRDVHRIIYSNSAAAALKMLRKKLVAGDYPLWSDSPCAQLRETLKPQSSNGIFPAFGVGR